MPQENDQQAATAVEVRGLRVRRGDRLVLDGLDLNLQAGELTCLLGPSGSGKTTLMRCLAGVQLLAGGTVSIFGTDAGSRQSRGMVGYVTQAPSVYDDLSIID